MPRRHQPPCDNEGMFLLVKIIAEERFFLFFFFFINDSIFHPFAKSFVFVAKIQKKFLNLHIIELCIDNAQCLPSIIAIKLSDNVPLW